MSDLRELLYEPWCPICKCSAPKGKCGRHGKCASDDKPVPLMRSPLSERMPEAVPAGLESNEWNNGWQLRHQTATGPPKMPPVFGVDHITDEQAELLFIGNAVKVLLSATTGPQLGLKINNRPGDLSTRFAAELHRLADERDAAKETT